MAFSTRVFLYLSQPFPKPLHLPKHISPSLLSTTSSFTFKTSSSSGSSSNSINDAELASEMAKMKVPLQQKEEAMKRSRELLFEDLCKYLGLGPEDLKKRWRQTGEEERLEWLRGFVADWGLYFHPLSLKSVKQLVQEHLADTDTDADNNDSTFSSPLLRFPDLKKIFGLSSNDL